MKKSKLAFIQSLIALLLCLSMFVGTTFAWFTDEVTSAGNIIQSGTLDAVMEWKNDLSDEEWIDASTGAIYDYEYWEPGYTDVKYIKVTNAGNLAFKYLLRVIPNTTVDAGAYDLANVIDVYCAIVDDGSEKDFEFTAPTDRDLSGLNKLGTLAQLMYSSAGADSGILLPKEGSNNHIDPASISGEYYTGEVTVCLVLKMQEEAGNEYQNLSVGGGFAVSLMATQYTFENDSFGNEYDKESEWPGLGLDEDVTGNADVAVDSENKTTANTTITTNSEMTATVPSGVLVENTSLTLTVTEMESSQGNITTGVNDELMALDVHIEGVSVENEIPIVIDLGEVLPVGLNMGNINLYHVEDDVSNIMTRKSSESEVAEHNDFYYDPTTGRVVVAMATFSEVTLVADTENAWNGDYDYSWYTNAVMTLDDESTTDYTIANADQLAGFGAIVGGMNGQTQDSFSGKTVKLLSDINLGDKDNANEDLIFYPIGYYYNGDSSAPSSDVYSFEGTFDGNGHTISNFYQNTWEIKGDYSENYYKDAMGLFGYVYNGTVKNLTVDNFSSDGEFTPTGVIAAFAAGEAIFENIAITNCNPRVYNTGNGGIIGVAGSTSAANDDHITLKNITVDNSNKISALWGSWDVACGGLVGMYRGNVDADGNTTGDTITFINCHVAAQIDVYNDVCANYQYYAYRYAGMIIGSVRHNTTNEDGKTIPNMTGVSASGCTVNYGDWNDYYYCEFEKNTMASYSEDYQFSRVDHSELNFTDSNGNGVVDADERSSVTGCKHTHTAEENHQAIYLPFHQLFTGYSWGVSSIGIEELEGIENITVTVGEQEASEEKFKTKFTSDFLYRVGNLNEVEIGYLFEAVDDTAINDAGAYVRIDKLYDDADVTCEFTANTDDWTQGTLKFEGTGVVDIVVQDYDFCTPTTLKVEVVDAVNATTATSATENNVVLLNDCGFSSLEVSGGYALYGNGFTMTCSTDSYAKDFGYAFVTLEDGTLDNVQIVCPNFDYAALYKSNLTSSDNRSYTDSSGTTRYYNAKSGVMVSGNSQILNSRISGARVAVNVSGGNCVIDNSRIELGAVASVLVGAANSVTLRDVTLVQKPTASSYDSSKTLMGFSVLVMATSGGDAAPITLEGTLTQNAWVDENDKQYVPEDAQTIIDTVMGEEEYLHDIDGDSTNESLNLGIAYMPADGEYTVNTPSITDNRSNKDTVPYDSVEVKYSLMTTYVYSYKNTNGTDDSIKTEGTYTPDTQSDIIAVSYSDASDGLTTGKSYGTDGWIYELNVDLDTLSGYELDFSKLSMSVNGVTVTDFKVDGSDKPSSPVTVTAGGTTYILTATVNETEYTATLKVTGTETSKESPSQVAEEYEDGLCVASSYGGTWHGAAPVLEGVQIKYWSVAEQQYKTITLSDYTPTTAGQQNGTNSYWTYTPDNGDFTLTIKNETPVHSGNSVYAMPVVVKSDDKNTLYFVVSSSNGLVNSGNSARTIAVTYYFNDNNNGDQLKLSHTWSVEENQDKQYKYSDFCNGTLTKLESSSSSCVTPDTLITLADGTQVRVDSLSGSEELLVWNMETGMLDSAPILFVDSESETEYEIVHLYFSDGTDVKVIGEHGFWDYDLNKYVYLDRYADKYIGHTFAKQLGEELVKVQLTDVVLETEVTTAWSPVTEGHLCYFVNGMLSMPGGVGGLFNIFDVDAETMTYDYEAMEEDIATYGLFTHEELNAICPLSEEMFNLAGGAYLKVSIGKGNLTTDELIYMINRYSKFF